MPAKARFISESLADWIPAPQGSFLWGTFAVPAVDNYFFSVLELTNIPSGNASFIEPFAKSPYNL